jgi:GNAT superfamily N-acetyltransferase
MHTRVIQNKTFGLLTIRPLRHGDTDTVCALFNRLSTESRARRFMGAKPRLTSAELEQLATVDGRQHVLVAYVGDDPGPAGIARLVRDTDEWRHAEVAFAVADRYQGHCIGSALVELLAADARAAGITHLTATMLSSNAAAYRLIRNVGAGVDVRHEAGETTLVAALQTA